MTEKEKLEAAIVKAARTQVEGAMFDLERQRRRTTEAQERADRLEQEANAAQEACNELKRERERLLTEIDQIRHETALSKLRGDSLEEELQAHRQADIEKAREFLIRKLTSLFGFVGGKRTA